MIKNLAHIKYRPDIDGLRAIAVSLVIMAHYFPKFFPGGFVGVDIFFVISGFLITFNILKDISNSSFSFKDFYAARTKRIVPALLVVIIFTILVGYYCLDASELIELSKEAISGSAYFLNFHMVKSSGYFDIASRLKPFLHLWSLSLEEQFYLILPMLIFYVCSKRSLSLLKIFLGIGAISFLININCVVNHPTFSYYLLPTRFWEFLVGSLVAYVEFKCLLISFRKSRLFNMLEFFFLSALLLLVFKWNAKLTFPGYWALIPVFVSAFVILGEKSRSFVYSFLSIPFLVLLGRISYPLYLWHWPLISISTILFGPEVSLSIKIYCLLMSFVLSVGTYYFIERPIRSNRKLQSSSVIAIGLVSVFIVILMSLFTMHHKGFPGREVATYPLVSKKQIERNLGTSYWDALNLSIDQSCTQSAFSKGLSVDYCRLTSADPKVAIIGDSHANHLVPGLSALHDERYSDLIQVSYGGCDYLGELVLFNMMNSSRVLDCYKANNRFVSLIRNDINIKTVFLSYANINLFNPQLGVYKLNGGMNVKVESSDIFRETFDSLSGLIESFDESKKTVVFFIDIPHMNFDLKECLYSRKFSFLTDRQSKCYQNFTDVLSEQYKMRKIAEQLKKAHPKLKVVDLPSLMCKDGICPLEHDGKLLYKDSDHLSLDGSIYVSQLLKSEFDN